MRYSRNPLVWALLFSVAYTAACSDGQPSEPASEMLSYAEIAGEWTGTIIETVPDTSYVALLSLGAEAQVGSVVGSIDYPALECGGALGAFQSEDPVYRVRELLTYGTDRCTQGGTITLTHDPGAGTLLYDWCCPLRGKTTGVLKRIQ
jgi:hypothetical protein